MMNTLSSLTSIMTDNRLSNSFKSYISGFEDDSLNTSADEFLGEQLAPRLLPGETIIAEAQKVLMFVQVSERKKGKSGSLYVTNFKLSFITPNDDSKQNSGYLDHLNLGVNDVCLSNVDSLYLMGDKKKKLIPGKTFSDKVRGLYVVCKNMKVMKFSFKFSPIGHGKTLATALLHHAFPKRHQLLFAYDFTVPNTSYPSETIMFREAGDWGRELARTQSHGWRLSQANIEFKMSPSLPKWVIVPEKVTERQLCEAARHFQRGRPPTWCWSSQYGAALVKMADLEPSKTDRVQENIMLENVRNSHPKKAQPVVLDLTKDLPSIKDISSSFNKLRDICSPDEIKQFWVQDNHFYLYVESTKWLTYVSACLTKALYVAKILYRETTVVLQENQGRDMCCVIASLSQILIDPYFRTVIGFQSLIQKEWIAGGHPFSTRLGHVFTDPNEQSPVFLMFLDCVWQLTQQFPTEFQFSETYLTALWECALVSTYETFLFDCEYDRHLATTVSGSNTFIMRSIWDDNMGFQESGILYNPFYSPRGSKLPLPVKPSVPYLELWKQCYFRHNEILEIIGGGNIQVEMEGRILSNACQEGLFAETSIQEGLDSLASIGSFFPFSTSDGSQPGLNCSLLMSSLSLNQSFHSTDNTIAIPD